MKNFNDVNVLIVDDEVEICKATEMFLKTYGLNTFIAYNGKEAFTLVKNNPIDFVISDVKMQGGDGIELLENIKKYNPNIPTVLLVTGYAQINKKEAQDKGALDLLNKPVDFDIIIKYIEKFCLS